MTWNVSDASDRLPGKLDQSTIFGPHLLTALMLLTKRMWKIFLFPGSYLDSKSFEHIKAQFACFSQSTRGEKTLSSHPTKDGWLFLLIPRLQITASRDEVLTVSPVGSNARMGNDEVTDYKRKMRKGRESKAGRWRSVCDGRMEAADEVGEFQIFEGR